MTETIIQYHQEIGVGTIGNYYGGLVVGVNMEGEPYWSIDGYGGSDEKIPAYLYEALIKFKNEGYDDRTKYSK